MKKQSQESWLDWKCVETGKIAGQTYWILPGRMWENEELRRAKAQRAKQDIIDILQRLSDECGYNGYIHFKKRPVREKGYNGIMAYVPVHGGITYASEDKQGIVYGFDTAHATQEGVPIRDRAWIKSEIQAMRRGILRAAKVEKKYLTAKTGKTKAKLAATVFTMKRPANKLGFSAMINLLTGEI